MLHPPRLGEMLRELLIPPGDDVGRGIDDQRSDASGAGIQGQDHRLVGRHIPYPAA